MDWKIIFDFEADGTSEEIIMGSIFYIDENGKPVRLSEQKYESEDLLQQLVEQYPDILAGEQINPDTPRKWILISREMGIPGQEGGSDQWFLDHLFIDQDGVPTFVEVKRSTDTRIRREVVAQMLDYAANATVYWPASRLRQTFEEHCDDPGTALYDNLGVAPEETDSFWEKVDSNLRLGKLRLLFVADEIPASLQRIIEFLNGQMTDTEVLGLEIKQFVSSTNHRTLVPKLIGQTVSSVQAKSSQRFEWTEESFLDRVQNISGEAVEHVCENLLRDFTQMGCYIYWGQGGKQAGFVPILPGKHKDHQLIAVYSYSAKTKVEIYFQHFKAPFDRDEKKRELMNKFNSIAGIQIGEEFINRRPSIDCTLLCNKTNYTQFVEIYREMVEEIKAYEKQTQ